MFRNVQKTSDLLLLKQKEEGEVALHFGKEWRIGTNYFYSQECSLSGDRGRILYQWYRLSLTTGRLWRGEIA